MKYQGIGKRGLAISILIMAAMCAASFLFAPGTRLSGESGICLPSPNLWDIVPIWSWGINTFLLGAIAAGLFFLNRYYNFIRSTEPVLSTMFLVLAASNPWNDTHLSAATIICAVNILCLAVLFSCYRKQNATQEIFIIATFLSIGSMCQYAFLPFIVPMVAGAIIMKAFRLKELCALLMGLIAPYWMGVGLGLIPLDSFTMPEISNLFTGFAATPDLLMLFLSVGIAGFIGLVLGFNNSIKLYAGKSRINALNMAISLTGVMSMICIIIDFTNMMAYLTTLFFTVAVQIANLCALWPIKREWLVGAVPALIYIILFLIMLFS